MFLRSVFQRLAPASHTRAARRRRGAQTSYGRRGRQFEPLEDRRVLAVLYAANDAGFQITNDTAPPGLSAGDTVTWAGGGQFNAVPNLTFGTNAFDSINAAIAAASDGDTIEVASGTYSEQVDVTKSITLLGAEHGVDARSGRAGAAESVFDAAGNSGKTQFIVGAGDVVIDGFTIQKQTSGNAFGAAIEIQPGHHGTHVVNDIIQNNQVGLSLANDSYTDQAVVQFDLFQDNNQPGVSGGTAIYSDQTVAGGALDYVLIDSNKLVGNANYGIDISPTDPNNGAWNVTISNNTIDANGRGIYLSDVPLASVSGNDITNEVTPADGGESVAIGVEGNSSVTVMDNNLHGGVGNGIQVGSDSPADQSDATINNNSIYGFAGESVSVGSGYGASRPVNATENWWGTNDSATIAGELSGRVAFSPYLDNASNTIASGPGFQSYLTQIDVTQLSPQWGSVGPIAQGVNDTAPGGVLTVQAGTYTEADVSISSNITVQGIGNVVLQAPTAGSGTGILIVVSASGVTISNLSIENFAQGISSEGIPQQPILLSPPAVNPPARVIQPANIQLTDVTLRGNTTGADLYSLNQLSITTTTSDDQVVDISPPAAGLPADYPDTVQFASQDAIRFNSPAVVVSTGAGSDTFNVSPLQDATITINGGSPPPPATPGDTLNVDTGGTTGGNLSVSAFPGGLSGAWTFDNAKPVDFSGIETLPPLTLDGQGAESITATEGIATGNVVVATFTDSASGHLLSDYSAGIDWGDGTSSTGSISYDSSSQVYSVIGNHTYIEDPNPLIVGPINEPMPSVTVHRAGSPDLTLHGFATVAEPALTGAGLTLTGKEQAALIDATVATFTHGSGAEAADDFTATIDWGDGTSSAGAVSLAGGTYSVAGSHTYNEVGSFAVTVTVNDDSRRTTINSAADIGPELPPSGTLFVANDSGYQITNDTGTPGLSTGDTVTWAGGGSAVPVAGLTFGTNAFDSIEAAIAAAAAGDTIEVASGSYTEGDVVIDKDLTLEGAGNVVLESPHDGAGVGITINGNPSSVTIADFTIKNFQSSLFADGVGNLNLTDLSLQANAGLYIPFSEIQNVQNLNLLDTSNTGGSVYVNPPSTGAPIASVPAGPPPEISFFSLEGFDISGVAHLSLQTGGGNDTFYVSPRSDTSISIDAGNPTPPSTPGDILTMNLYGITGANLSDTRDASGFSGTWTFANAKPVSFSHIETVSPSSVMANGAGQAITATEGVSTGNVVVATFSDSASGLPLTDYSAGIDWGDGTSSTGTVSLDTSSGVYSVSGSHTYAEDGSEQIAVVVHRTSAPDATLDATATVVEPPLVQLFPPVVAPLGHEGAAITVDVGFFTHGNNTEPASGFTATIDWGDGTTSTGQVDGGNGSSYIVSGTHTYDGEGHFTVKATLVDTSGGNTLALSTVVAMREALLPNGTEGTADERFVSEVYNDLLHRPVDANGLAYWSGKLTGGASRGEVVAGIENTDEYRHAVVASLYQTYLGRAA